MKIDLNVDVRWRTAIKIVEYCIENQIEIHKCWVFHNLDNLEWEDLEFDIPDEHISWMILKGILE